MRQMGAEVMPLFGISADDVADTTDDYYTPRWIFDAAGIIFDMDVAAPVDPARRTCPARRYLTPIEDGLTHPWDGLVWMNPPYSAARRWVPKFALHGCGLALLPALKEVTWLGTLLANADAIAVISTDFISAGRGRSMPFPMILAACGPVAVDALVRVAAADRYVCGAYHVRPGLM